MLTNYINLLSASAKATMNKMTRGELKKFCPPKVVQYKVCVCVVLQVCSTIPSVIFFHLRSTQRSTLLLACVSSTNIEEYGFERILERFISDINELSELGVDCE